MIEKIIPDRISLTLPTVFGEELSFLEFCGKLRAKLNESIDVVNENTTDIQQNATAISRNESDIVKLNGVVNSISAQADENTVNINTVSGKVDKNTSDIQQNTADIQQNATAISRNESDIVKLNGVVNSISAQADENTVNINTVSGKVDKNTSDIQQNTADIQQNATAISRNESDIVKLNGVVNSISAQADENTVNINTVSGKVDKNTSDIQQNTADIQQNATAISRNESDIVKLNGVVNSISAQADENTADILNRKIESLFAPVILNVENHEAGADINASVYIRMGRIDWQGLGCLYAKVNISFSGATDAKTLKINSIQFGTRKAADITNVSTSFTAKTNVFGIPISIVGTETLSVGTSDIAVTGINLLGMSIVAESLASSFSLDSIPTGIDIPCESLAFTSPGGGESDPKIVYTLKIAEGNIDIYLTSGGNPLTTENAILNVDFTDTISDSMIYDQFICAGGVYDEDTISSISENGQVLGAALINHTGYTDNGHVYNARMIIRDADNIPTGGKLSLKPTGIATKKIPLGEFAHVSLTFDMFSM